MRRSARRSRESESAHTGALHSGHSAFNTSHCVKQSLQYVCLRMRHGVAYEGS